MLGFSKTSTVTPTLFRWLKPAPKQENSCAVCAMDAASPESAEAARKEPVSIATVTSISSNASAASPASEAAVVANGRLAASDYESWLEYLRTRKVSELKRGVTLAQEYERWMAMRTRARA